MNHTVLKSSVCLSYEPAVITAPGLEVTAAPGGTEITALITSALLRCQTGTALPGLGGDKRLKGSPGAACGG